jgi:hypothetical protein
VDVVPSQVYAEQEIQFLTITNWAPSTGDNRRTHDRRPVEEIKIGDYNTDMDLITADTAIEWSNFATPFTVKVGD